MRIVAATSSSPGNAAELPQGDKGEPQPRSGHATKFVLFVLMALPSSKWNGWSDLDTSGWTSDWNPSPGSTFGWDGDY